MKKIAIYSAIIFCVSNLLSLNVLASNVIYDEDEFYSTLKDSFDFYYEFFYRADGELMDSSASPITIESDNGEVMPYNVYYPRNDELADWNKFCDKLNSYYTNEIGNIFIDNMKGFEHSGKLFVSETIFGQAQSNAPYFSFHELGIDLETRETFKLIKESDGKLLYEFCVFDQYIDAPIEAPDEDRLLDLTVEFTHTESGWRISGGTVVDTYLYGRSYDYYLNGAPQTSLTTAVYAAVAALALGVVVVKKKRG